MDQRWREARKTINEQRGELDYGTTSRRTEDTPTPRQLWDLRNAINSSEAKLAMEKQQYNRVIEAYWKLWVETEKCVVIGLQLHRQYYTALCLWELEGKMETIECAVTWQWIEKVYGRAFFKTMADATEATAEKDKLFYPTTNSNDYCGWILAEPVSTKRIWYVGKKASFKSSGGLPGELFYSSATDYEYELTNGDVLRIDNKRVYEEFGKEFVASNWRNAKRMYEERRERRRKGGTSSSTPGDDNDSSSSEESEEYKSDYTHETKSDDESGEDDDLTESKSETKIPASVTTDGKAVPNVSNPPQSSSQPSETQDDDKKPAAIDTTNNPVSTPPHSPLASTTSPIADASRERASINDDDNNTNPPVLTVLGQVATRPPLGKALESLLSTILSGGPLTQPPPIRYRAGPNVNCAFASMASVLRHVGLTNEAECVMNAALSFNDPETQDPLLMVRDAFKAKDDNGKTRFGHMQFCTLKPWNFRLLFEDNKLRRLESSVLFLLAISNDNDKTNTSVVSIFNDWIYDANMDRAVPYNYDFMRHVMSSMVPDANREGAYITTKGNFTGILKGFAFYECRSNKVKNHMKTAGSTRDVTGGTGRPRLDLSTEAQKERAKRNKNTNLKRKSKKRARSTDGRVEDGQSGEQQGIGRRDDEKEGKQPQQQGQEEEEGGRKRQREDSRSDNDE